MGKSWYLKMEHQFCSKSLGAYYGIGSNLNLTDKTSADFFTAAKTSLSYRGYDDTYGGFTEARLNTVYYNNDKIKLTATQHERLIYQGDEFKLVSRTLPCSMDFKTKKEGLTVYAKPYATITHDLREKDVSVGAGVYVGANMNFSKNVSGYAEVQSNPVVFGEKGHNFNMGNSQINFGLKFKF